MELVRFADRRKYRNEDRSPDEQMLTRRMFLLKGLVVTGFTALAGRLWQMQLVETERYNVQAEGNIRDEEPIPAPRGLIYDRQGDVLADNRVAWQVLVTPAQLPLDPDERAYVRSQVIEFLELRDMLAIRRHAAPDGVSDALIAQIGEETGIGVEDIQERVDAARDDDNLIILRNELSNAETRMFTEAARRVPGLVVINYFDYLVDADPASASPRVLARDIDRDVALALESNKLYLPGVTVDGETLTRQYRAGPAFAHLLGYVGPISEEEYDASRQAFGESPYLRTDYVGRGGLEQALEDQLRGRRGMRQVQIDVRGLKVGEFEHLRVDPESGRNVHLTIDRRFQHSVTRALQEGIEAANETAQAEDREEVGSGVVIAMDPRNGEILAMVSLPTFDNQRFVDGISQSEYDQLLDNQFNPLVNLAASGAFPPGSTLKPLLGSMALEEGTIGHETRYRCVGTIDVPTVGYEAEHNTYVCWFREGHGAVNIEEAIAESCNIFFYNVGAPNQTPAGADEPLHYFLPGDQTPHYFEGLGIELIERYLREEFRFGEPTGIELANESSGVVPNPQWLFQSPLREYWSVGDTINVSIGQGHLECSPLQLTAALCAIANGGAYYRPRLVRGYSNGNGDEIHEVDPELLGELDLSQETIQIIRRGLLRTVTEGTAMNRFPRTGDGIPIAGKTGTADFGEAVDGSYTRQHAWFTAFAPFDDPEIMVTVLIPGGGEGSTWAIPVADAVLASYFGMDDLDSDDEELDDEIVPDIETDPDGEIA